MKLMTKFLLAMLALGIVAGLAAPAVAGGDLKGKITKVDPQRMQFVMTDKDGKSITIVRDEDAQVTINNQDALWEDLKPGDQVSIRGHGNGTDWMAVEVRSERSTAPESAGDDTQGKLTKVEPDRMQFVLQDKEGKTFNFSMDEDAQVFINNQEASLNDLKAGDQVSVRARRDGTDWMAIEVRCERQQ